MRTEISSIREVPGLHTMGHTCTNLNGDLFFVWGGTNDEVGLWTTNNIDLWIYETLTGYWRHRTCTGDCPPHLSSSASCLIGRRMFVFGGHSSLQDNWLNCLYCLDLETFVWRDLSGAKATPTKPIRSDKNVCWSYGGKLYLFGGYGWSQTEHYLEILDRQPDLQLAPDQRWPKFGWNNQLVSFDPRLNLWDWPRYTGKCPSARAAHSGALMGDKYYVFGGRDSCQRLNDLYILDMNTLSWQQINMATNSVQVGPVRELEYAADIEEAANNELDNQELVDEMREDDDDSQDEEENLIEAANENPSPSSSTAHEQASGLPSSRDELSLPHQEDDDYDEDDDAEEYPYRSHLLERLSLSSSSHQSASGAEQDCHFGEDEQQLSVPAQSALFFSDNENNLNQDEPQESDVRPPDSISVEEPTSRGPADGCAERFPMGRSFCSFTPLSDDRILLFGGVSSQDQKLDDCWLYDINQNRWNQIDLKHKKPRLWHTGSRTRHNEVVIIGGSNSDKIDEFSTDVLVLSMEPKTLKRLALDAVSRSVRLRTIQRTRGIPSTICKLIRLRKQAMALTLRSPQHQ